MRTLVRERREKDAKIGGPGRIRTSNQTVMSGPVSPESSNKIDVFRRVGGRSFASVHGVSVVYLWSVRHFPGTRAGGFVLTREEPTGKWGAATYSLACT
jgi:hypothetical protein